VRLSLPAFPTCGPQEQRITLSDDHNDDTRAYVIMHGLSPCQMASSTPRLRVRCFSGTMSPSVSCGILLGCALWCSLRAGLRRIR
jgi:hypothetical protein